MSELGRLFGIFWAPKAVFENLVSRPRWWVPLILGIVVGLVLIYMFSHVVGWETYMEQKLAENPRTQDLSPEVREKILSQQLSFVGIASYVGATVGPAVILLTVAGVLLFLFRSFGGADLTFRQAFSITCYAWLPFVLYSILSLVVMSLTRPQDYNLENPLPFNVGWFLSGDTPAGLRALAGSLDVFSFWVMALLALGFSVAARRIRFGKAFTIVVAAWLVVVVIKTGWAAMFG